MMRAAIYAALFYWFDGNYIYGIRIMSRRRIKTE